MRRFRITALILLLGVGIHVDEASGEDCGFAEPTTGHSYNSTCDDAYTWNLYVSCRDECGAEWASYGPQPGSAPAACGIGYFCPPSWKRYNYKNGLYAETSAYHGDYGSLLVGCRNSDQWSTTGFTCGCATPCDDETSDGGGGTGGPLDDDTGGGGGGVPSGGDGCQYGCSPIVINMGRGVIRLSGLDDPVHFDIDEDAYAETLSWTERDSETAFLAYDRDGDGVIGGGSELFGNFTLQPGPQDEHNGFRALAVFDQASSGGNADGWITAEDPVFEDLRLWFDADHDAVSQEHELFTLADYGIEAIELDYIDHRRRDRHGNEFRYSSRVRFEGGRTTRAVDVFLLSESP